MQDSGLLDGLKVVRHHTWLHCNAINASSRESFPMSGNLSPEQEKALRLGQREDKGRVRVPFPEGYAQHPGW